MDIIITNRALNSYLDLLHGGYITTEIYWKLLRPVILLVRRFPDAAKFGLGKFWSPATGRRGRIPDGYKMKWHNVRDGQVQLRLPVAIVDRSAYLSKAYVKKNRKKELRELAKFSVHIERIRQGKSGEVARL